ncbi:MAG: gamma-glutamylcyclotransferase [Alphaproteobacteria bacterium]|nr:gamma-glutamylcyclotransferase [Alphaproteobacteria bacterium]
MTRRASKICFTEPGDVWFFAYGSLMWNPGFPFEEDARATLRGYHRAFCVNSRSYRGTRERPGLVLGLDRGGTCVGQVFRVAHGEREKVAAYLEERELPEDIYSCRHVPVTTAYARLLAYAFVVNRAHFLYAGKLTDAEIIRRLATCGGNRGSNRAYLENTVAHLDALGIGEGHLHAILRAVRAIPPDAAPPAPGPPPRPLPSMRKSEV